LAAEELTGKGHMTWRMGEEPRAALPVPLAQA
jgi:hypothetical protein